MSMKKTIGFIMLVTFLALTAAGFGTLAHAGAKGKIRVSTDREGAYIYVNGKKKAMSGEGYTNILLPEGEYKIKVEKFSNDGNWIYRGVKKVFVGADTSTKVTVKTKKIPTEKKKKADAKKARIRKEKKRKIVKNKIQDSKFILIKPGTFMMGSPSNEPERNDDELRHKVTISKSFYLQATEVTQGQWKAVMGDNPSDFKNCGNDCPVEKVSWDDIQQFIKKLNRMTGKKYRLPTEAEWEYACRAGTTTPFNTGRCLLTNEANYDGNSPLKGCSKGKYREKTMPVASFSPNAWGLYDMHGNVWEWCSDWYGDYPTGSVVDPVGLSGGSDRVRRGGSWINNAGDCRSAHRYYLTPGYRVSNLGLRLALSPGQ